MSEADSNNRSDVPRDRSEEDRSFDAEHGAQGAPNGKARDRGSSADAPGADSVMPGREFGAGSQVDDGPDETAGAGGA
ncbi:hypothetical protein [Phenylobacterium sp.]|uniref:hypothetical protein n=1 Tax=Phenylobacterium sp. TaxID=1871053 RepID=UPI0028117D6A|nr:hypothetical protein [Phenylobacterium sp.]